MKPKKKPPLKEFCLGPEHPIWIIMAEKGSTEINPYWVLKTFLKMCPTCRKWSILQYFGSVQVVDKGWFDSEEVEDLIKEGDLARENNIRECESCFQLGSDDSIFIEMEESWFEDRPTYWQEEESPKKEDNKQDSVSDDPVDNEVLASEFPQKNKLKVVSKTSGTSNQKKTYYDSGWDEDDDLWPDDEWMKRVHGVHSVWT